MVQLSEEIIEKLTYRGVLAYVAVSVAGSGVYTTALLASSVRCKTETMKDGMDELSVHHPDVVQWIAKKKRWYIGGAANPVGALEEKDRRRENLVDDLKRYWDFLNPQTPFSFGAPDGFAVGQFLKRNRAWSRAMWIGALRNRCKSEINKSESIYRWLSKLEEYAAGPLDRYMKPLEGAGKHGEAVSREAANRAARESLTQGNRV